VGAWRRRASEIPDAPLRQDAISALARKRGQSDGAALLSTIPRARNPALLRLLTVYQIIWDFLDSVNERAADAGPRNGRQLHLALVDALDLDRPTSDYYEHHPWKNDGGYLQALVTACRDSCRALPSYERVRASIHREATRAQVLAINHDLDPTARDAALKRWAINEFPAGHEASWFELSGAASAGLTIFALLLIAVEPTCDDASIAKARDAYFPWISVTATMLDSYVDRSEDIENNDHSYVAHYPNPELGVRRMRELIERSLREARSLSRGEYHTLIVACMVAMYLSKDSARTEAMNETTAGLVSAGGSLTRLLRPILRLWRIAYGQRST
jgi:tetraprenyl-beta-curcumene synthase